MEQFESIIYHEIPISLPADRLYIAPIEIYSSKCFGSKLSRDDAVSKNPFMASTTCEIYPNVYPGKYYDYKDTFIEILKNKFKGRRGLGNQTKRFEKEKFDRVPSPTRYNPLKKPKIRKCRKPFNQSSSTQPIRLTSHDTPGPGNYHIKKLECRRSKYQYNFGHPTMINAVETYCTPVLMDVCHKCKNLCNKDYWHKDFNIFLCHFCWTEEKNSQEIYSLRELKKFQKIRNCTYLHRHENTSVACRLLTPQKVKKRLHLENYLDKYLSCFD